MQSPSVNPLMRYCSVFGKILAYLLAIFPISFIALSLYRVGANNISNDNLLILPLVDEILSGSYQWSHFFRDVYFNDHFQLFSILTQVFVAKFFSFNVYVILWVGLLLAVVKLIYLYLAITIYSGARWRYLWLVALSFLVFSPSQFPTFESDWNTIMVGLTQAGAAIGLWGLVRFCPNRKGLWIMAVGGIFASFSSGMGPLAWPGFLVAMILLNYRKFTDYLIWILSALVGTFPYLYFRVLSPVVRPYDNPKTLHALKDHRLLLEALGWPFKQGMNAELSYLTGWVGVGFLAIALLIAFFRRRNAKTLEAIAAPIMLVIWGLVTALVVSIFRGSLTPWYAAFFMPYWIGLFGFAYVFYSDKSKRGRVFSNAWILSLFLFITFLYVGSVASLNENRFFIKQRSPVAASCLRAFESAPTYCAEKLFSWDLHHYEEYLEYAKLLKRNRLSVFSDRQVWTLQGDYVLGAVKVVESPGLPKAFWSPDLSNRSSTFFAPEHLNLFLHSPNFLEWEMTLPSDLEYADLYTAFAFNQSAPFSGDPDGATFSISARLKDGSSVTLVSQYIPPQQREWVPVKVSLASFAGKSIVLKIGSDGLDNITHDWAMYRYPYLEIKSSGTPNGGESAWKAVAENTDLSSRYPGPLAGDFHFPAIAEHWILHGAEITDDGESTKFRVTGEDPWIEYKDPLGMELGKFSRFFVKISADGELVPRYVQVYYKLNGKSSFEEKYSFKVPLLQDQGMHEYSYDLKLLELGAGDVLTGIRIDPIPQFTRGVESSVSIQDIGLSI